MSVFPSATLERPAIDGAWQPERIAVMRALKLGDLLCATPALRALRRRFPAAEITLIGLPWAEELVRRLPALDRLAIFPGYPGIIEVAHLPERTAAFVAEAHAYRYDLAIQMHGDGTTSNGFVAALSAPVTLGYRKVDDDRLTISLPYVADEPEVLRWLRLVALLGAPVDDRRIAFPVTPKEDARAATILRELEDGDGPLVGLHPGASEPHRRWPAERFAALANELSNRWEARVVLTGSEEERDLTAAIAGSTRAPVLDLAGQTDLGVFAALIGQLGLLVTNDTGASHLAASSATPSVVIFGTTPPHQWAPLDGERHLVVDARTFAPPHLSQTDALAALPLPPVLAACERHLGTQPYGTRVKCTRHSEPHRSEESPSEASAPLRTVRPARNASATEKRFGRGFFGSPSLRMTESVPAPTTSRTEEADR